MRCTETTHSVSEIGAEPIEPVTGDTSLRQAQDTAGPRREYSTHRNHKLVVPARPCGSLEPPRST